MFVTKRNGSTESLSFDKVLRRIEKLSYGLNVNYSNIAQKVISRIYNGVLTSELDEIATDLASSMIAIHPDYDKLATRIAVSNHHKKTSPSFSEVVNILFNNKRVNEEFYNIVMDNKDKINSYIDYERDYLFDIFGFKTLEKMYLLRIQKDINSPRQIIERPQHMFMRVSIGIHGDNIRSALETYDLLSKQFMIHATPTLFNSGTLLPQMSSCFLLHVPDSVEGMYDTVKECAIISKHAGGIGLHIQDMRSANSNIRGTGGVSNGIVPYMKVLNYTAKNINQGGKRNGSIAVYIEPWHSDIREFLDTKKPQGSEDSLCRDLFIALFVNDLFMKRVKDDKNWSLMNPDICIGLTDAYGEDFDKLYEYYENNNQYTKQIKARDLWNVILKTQIESGMPYMIYKDSVNKLSNQSNLGTIKSSNLCAEIMQYSDEKETAVCNLASIGLPAFVNKNHTFNFDELRNTVRVLVTNL